MSLAIVDKLRRKRAPMQVARLAQAQRAAVLFSAQAALEESKYERFERGSENR